MALPNFFIIGAAKAGTTSLHHYLGAHPQVQMAAVKETNHFAGPADGLPYPAGRVVDRGDYEALFDPACEVRGEASPSYTNAPRRAGVPERIKAAVPQARFIYLVRDPIARTVSHYRMLVAAGKERRSLPAALADLSRIDPRSFYLTSQSLYAHQLEHYLRHFPEDRVLVLDQSALRTDRAGTLSEAFGFLGVDAGFSSAEFEAELFRGSERRAYPPFFRRFVKPVLRVPARLLPESAQRPLRRRLERTLAPVPEPRLDPGVRARLEDLFGPDVERLRRLTGREFPGWSV